MRKHTFLLGVTHFSICRRGFYGFFPLAEWSLLNWGRPLLLCMLWERYGGCSRNTAKMGGFWAIVLVCIKVVGGVSFLCAERKTFCFVEMKASCAYIVLQYAERPGAWNRESGDFD